MPKDQPSNPTAASGVQVNAIGLNKWVRKDLNILQDISLSFQPREFIVVVGQSGGGKSTLVDAIAGYSPATDGHVLVNGVDVYRHFDAVRDRIGYVPQRDIIHMELTVFQALDYAAKLRLPRGTPKKERRQRIEEVLDDLDLAHRKDVQISRLSGGQQKRVSIGVELLTRPELFFLDEPTSGLDPGTETALMQLMRKLADQGRTIILITHATKNVMLADKVVFLARGGYLAWFGPPEEALKYFAHYHPHRKARPILDRLAPQIEFDDIYSFLDDPANGTPQDWAERFQKSSEYQKYIAQPLKAAEEKGIGEKGKGETAPVGNAHRAPVTHRKPVTALGQFIILSSRNIKILTRDRASLILMLLAPILIGSLDLLIAPIMGRNIYDFYEGKAPNASMTLFLLTLYTVLVGSLSQMREFIKEQDIYRRERLVNLKILPYAASKVWVAMVMAAYHAAAFTAMRYFAYRMPGGNLELALVYVTLFLSAFAGMMLGLLASARAPTAGAAPMLTILLIIPNIVLSGVLVSLPQPVSSVSSSYWAFKGLMAITGIGSDVAADDCWKFPDSLRTAMTLDDKAFYGCKCLGADMFDPDSCNFPGMGSYYNAALGQPKPVEPSPLGDPPAEPALPAPPDAPADQGDPVQVAMYLNALQTYQSEVALIQDEFKQQMADYQALSEVYKTQAAAYQKELTTWYMGRTASVGAAEGIISGVRDRFGWAFVNKKNPQQYWMALGTGWAAQGLIVLALFVAILIIIKRKDKK